MKILKYIFRLIWTLSLFLLVVSCINYLLGIFKTNEGLSYTFNTNNLFLYLMTFLIFFILNVIVKSQRT